MRHLAGIVLAAVASFAATGCMQNSPDEYSWPAKDLPAPEGWYESGPFVAHEFDVLWEAAKGQAVKGGYRIDDDATSYRQRRIVTTWKTELATVKNDGKRRRRFVEVVAQKEPASTWKVRVSTVKQRNVDIDDPLNPVSAEWRTDEPDIDDAEIVAWRIESEFRRLGPSKEFEMR